MLVARRTPVRLCPYYTGLEHRVELANKLIARELGISEKTVKSHLTAIFHRLGVTDRVQAAMWAHDHDVASASRSFPR